MEDRTDAGQEYARQEDSGHNGCRTGQMQDRLDTAQDGCRPSWIQDREDAGQDGCRLAVQDVCRAGRMQDRKE